MKKTPTHLDGLYVIKNTCFKDKRGDFWEFWNKEIFKTEGLDVNFDQDNISISKKNVIRGLHFQNQPYSQTKYVSVIKGSVLDVAVDIRKKSKTFGEHFIIELSHKNNLGLWIPTGFAHGFLALEKDTVFNYKCAGSYNPKQEHTIKWNDRELNIKWGITTPIISKKDNNGISFEDYKKSNLTHG